MIGNWLRTLTPEQEERLLTAKMGRHGTRAPCLVMAALPHRSNMTACMVGVVPASSYRWRKSFTDLPNGHKLVVAGEYDHLCVRFGEARVNAAIRDRISRNQLRRALSSVPSLEGATRVPEEVAR